MHEKLRISDKELENQLAINFSLKKQITDYELRIKHLTQTNNSTPNNNTPIAPKGSTISGNRQEDKLLKHESLEGVKQKICKLLSELNRTSQELEFLLKEMNMSGLMNNKRIRNDYYHPKVSTYNKEKGHKDKICLLSTNRNHNILSIAEQTFSDNYNMCHYLMPNVKTDQLLKGIETKIADFTMRDYCIILLGHEDFKTTRNYEDLVLHLRETLQRFDKTNIIICLPTFKCSGNSNMFNQRIEYFNNLLYQDNKSHIYAYLLDSNLNLKYDNTMFHRHGTVNKTGMQVIFRYLHEMINEITLENNILSYHEVLSPQDDHIVDSQVAGTSKHGCLFRD